MTATTVSNDLREILEFFADHRFVEVMQEFHANQQQTSVISDYTDIRKFSKPFANQYSDYGFADRPYAPIQKFLEHLNKTFKGDPRFQKFEVYEKEVSFSTRSWGQGGRTISVLSYWGYVINFTTPDPVGIVQMVRQSLYLANEVGTLALNLWLNTKLRPILHPDPNADAAILDMAKAGVDHAGGRVSTVLSLLSTFYSAMALGRAIAIINRETDPVYKATLQIQLGGFIGAIVSGILSVASGVVSVVDKGRKLDAGAYAFFGASPAELGALGARGRIVGVTASALTSLALVVTLAAEIYMVSKSGNKMSAGQKIAFGFEIGTQIASSVITMAATGLQAWGFAVPMAGIIVGVTLMTLVSPLQIYNAVEQFKLASKVGSISKEYGAYGFSGYDYLASLIESQAIYGVVSLVPVIGAIIGMTNATSARTADKAILGEYHSYAKFWKASYDAAAKMLVNSDDFRNGLANLGGSLQDSGMQRLVQILSLTTDELQRTLAAYVKEGDRLPATAFYGLITNLQGASSTLGTALINEKAGVINLNGASVDKQYVTGGGPLLSPSYTYGERLKTGKNEYATTLVYRPRQWTFQDGDASTTIDLRSLADRRNGTASAPRAQVSLGGGNDTVIAGMPNLDIDGGAGFDGVDYSSLFDETAAGNSIRVTEAGDGSFIVQKLGAALVAVETVGEQAVSYGKRTEKLQYVDTTYVRAGFNNGRDTLKNVQWIRGSSGSDVFEGGRSDNFFVASPGNDRYDGGGGSDWIDYGTLDGKARFQAGLERDTALRVDLSAQTASYTSVRVGTITAGDIRAGNVFTTYTNQLVNMENVRGGSGNDRITGDARANILVGGGGSDSLYGGGGDDILSTGGMARGNSLLDGGSGNDTADYALETTDLVGVLGKAGATGSVSEAALSSGHRQLSARYILVRRSAAGNTGVLSLSEVQVMSGGRNVALGAATYESARGHAPVSTSPHLYTSTDHAGSNLVDGAFSNASADIYRSLDDRDAWVMIDLGATYDIDRIQLNGVAGDQDGASNNGRIFISNTSFMKGNSAGAGDDASDVAALMRRAQAGGNTAWADWTVMGINNTRTLGVGDFAGASFNDAPRVDTLKDIENLRTGSGNDRLSGNELANVLDAGGGNDSIDAGGGADTVFTGTGQDSVDAGDGDDVIYVQHKALSGKARYVLVRATAGQLVAANLRVYANGVNVARGAVPVGQHTNSDANASSGGSVGNVPRLSTSDDAAADYLNAAFLTAETDDPVHRVYMSGNSDGKSWIQLDLGQVYDLDSLSIEASTGLMIYLSAGDLSGDAASPERLAARDDTLYARVEKGDASLRPQDMHGALPVDVKTINGGQGRDRIDYQVAYTGLPLGVRADLATQTAQAWLNGKAVGSVDVFQNVEDLGGTQAADVLLGNDQANELRGYAGDDLIRGGGGDDVIFSGGGNDSIDAGSGNDVIYIEHQRESVQWTLDNYLPVGTSGAPVRAGLQVADIDLGAAGTRFTLKGNAVLEGQATPTVFMIDRSRTGTLSFWLGYLPDNTSAIAVKVELQDTPTGVRAFVADARIYYGATSGQSFDWTQAFLGGATVGFPIATSVSSFGVGVGAMTLNGFASGTTDHKVIDGGEGDDFIDYRYRGSAGTAGIDASLVTGQVRTWVAGDWTPMAGSTVDTLRNVENLGGTDAADRLVGDDGDNLLLGRAGNDLLEGGGGNDTLVTGTGNDTARGGDGDDVLTIEHQGLLKGRYFLIRHMPGVARNLAFAQIKVWSNGTNVALNARIVQDSGGNFAGSGPQNAIDGHAGNSSEVGGYASARNDGTSWIMIDLGASYVIDGIDISSLLQFPASNGPMAADIGVFVSDVNLAAYAADYNALKARPDTRTAELPGQSIDGQTLIGKDGMLSIGAERFNKGFFIDGKTLDGGNGSDTLDYSRSTSRTGVGIDVSLARGTVYTWLENGQVNSASAIDTFTSIENIIGTGAADRLVGDGAANSLSGGAGNDTIEGGDGNDTLSGGAGDDQLSGGAGDDIIDTGLGADTVDGGAGDDVIRVQRSLADASVKTLHGGEGYDQVDYALEAGMSIDASRGSVAGDWRVLVLRADGSLLVTDILHGVEAVSVSGPAGNSRIDASNAGNQRIAGENGNVVLIGGGGNDTLIGGAGDDTIFTGAGIDVVRGGDGNDMIYVQSSTTLNGRYILVRHVPGIAGYQGARLALQEVKVWSGGRNVALEARVVQGGGQLGSAGGNDASDNGNDWILLDLGREYVIDSIDVVRPTAGQALQPMMGSDLGIFVSAMDLGAGMLRSAADYPRLLARADVQSGEMRGVDQAATQSLRGDQFSTGMDRKTIDGGAGADLVDYRLSQPLFGQGIDASLLTGSVGGWNGDPDSAGGPVLQTLGNVEGLGGTHLADRLRGNDEANTLNGNGGDDLIYSGKGQDTIDGGGGDDLIYLQHSVGGGGFLDGKTIAGGDGNDLVDYRGLGLAGGIHGSLADNRVGMLDPATGLVRAGSDTDALAGIEGLAGTDLADRLTGDAQDNVLKGYGGDDSLSGGDGNDVIHTGTGRDRVDAGAGDDIIHVETGGTPADRKIIEGGEGTDLVDYRDSGLPGGVGISVTLRGGAGTVYRLQNGQRSSDGDALTGIEGIGGTDAADHLQGDDQDNVLSGYGGDDSIDGGAGDDVIATGSGNDTVNGGDGRDIVIVAHVRDGTSGLFVDAKSIDGGAGNDWVDYRDGTPGGFGVVASLQTNAVIGGDQVFYGQVQINGVTDQLRNVEDLGGTDSADRITGSLLANRLFGYGGDDWIDAGGGNDTIYTGTGRDTVLAGAGDDSIFVQQQAGALSGRYLLLRHLPGIIAALGLQEIAIWSNGRNVALDARVVEGSTAGVAWIMLDLGQSRVIDRIDLAGADLAVFIGDTDLHGDAANYGSLTGHSDTSHAELVGRAVNGDGSGRLSFGAERFLHGKTIDGGAGIDTVSYRGAYADPSIGIDGSLVAGADGKQRVNTWYQDGAVKAGSAFDTLSGIENLAGTDAADRLTGDANDNVLEGFGGDDRIDGGAGNDTLHTGTGRDSVGGGEGDDTIFVEHLASVPGGRYLLVRHLPTATAASLSYAGIRVWAGGSNVAQNARVIEGNGYLMIDLGRSFTIDQIDLIGNTGQPGRDGPLAADVSVFLSDNDLSVGLQGTADDYGRLKARQDAWHADLPGQTIDGIRQLGAGNSVGIGPEAFGATGGVYLDGKTIDGGAGTDLVSYRGMNLVGVGIDGSLQTGQVRTWYSGGQSRAGSVIDQLVNVEDLAGTEMGDRIVGDDRANKLAGFGGDDLIFGGGGDDVIFSGAGRDTIDGGDGNDVIFVDQELPVIQGRYVLLRHVPGVASASGFGDIGIWVRDAAGNLQNVAPNARVVQGGTGQGASDWVMVDLGQFRVIDRIDLGAPASPPPASAGVAVFVSGSDLGDDALNYGTLKARGDVQYAELTWQGGQLSFGAERFLQGKVIDGGNGEDLLSYRESQGAKGVGIDANLATGRVSTWFENGAVRDGSSVDIVANIENLGGTDAADRLLGDRGNNKLAGYDGNDTLAGGGGNDQFAGGNGSDTYEVGMLLLSAADAVEIYEEEVAGSGDVDTVHFTSGLRAALWFSRSGNDLLVVQLSPGANSSANLLPRGRLTVKDWYADPGARIERFVLGDYVIDGAARVEQLVAAQAAIASTAPPYLENLSAAQMSRLADAMETAWRLNGEASGPSNHAPAGRVTVGGFYGNYNGVNYAYKNAQLTAGNNLSDADGMGAITYQWQAWNPDTGGWDDIAGATQSRFAPTREQVNGWMQVVARYVDSKGNAESVASESFLVSHANDLPTGSVGLSGIALQGQTLTASQNLVDLDGLPGQLQMTGSATLQGQRYQLTPASGGAGAAWQGVNLRSSFTLKARVYLGDGNGADGMSFALQNQGAGALGGGGGGLGIYGVGSAFGIKFDTYQNAGEPAADHTQFFKRGNPFGTGFDTAIERGELEDGRWHDLTIHWDAGSHTLSYSLDGSAVAAKSHDVVGLDWSGNGEGWWGFTAATGGETNRHEVQVQSFVAAQYQWQVSGDNGSTWSDIAGATGGTFTLGQAQVGKMVRVVASYTDAFGTWESVETSPGVLGSAATTMVANVNDRPEGAVSITGSVLQGQTLRASHSLSDADGLGTITYEWQRRDNGVWTPLATGPNYTLTANEVGKPVRVVAGYTDRLGTVESPASDATVPVAALPGNPAPVASISSMTLTNSNGPDVQGTPFSASFANPFSDPAAAGGSTSAEKLIYGISGLPRGLTLRYRKATNDFLLEGVPVLDGVALTASATYTFELRATDEQNATSSAVSYAVIFKPPALAQASSNGNYTGISGNAWFQGAGYGRSYFGNGGHNVYVLNGAGNASVLGAATEKSTVVLSGTNMSYSIGADRVANVFANAGRASQVYGNAEANRLTGGSGNDVLAGGDGDDTYLLSRNGGVDTIIDSAGHDTLKWTDVDFNQLWLRKSGANLIVEVLGGGASVMVSGHYGVVAGTIQPIERIEAADGKYLDFAGIDALVQAMGTMTQPTGASTFSLTSQQQATLASLGVWQSA